MNALAYLINPATTIRKHPDQTRLWRTPVAVLCSVVLCKLGIQLVLGSRVEEGLLRAIVPGSGLPDTEQLRSFMNFNIITYVVTSFSVVSSWFLYSLFMLGWIMTFGSKRPDARTVFALNALALTPVLIHSVATLLSLITSQHIDLLSFDPPFRIANVQDLHEYASYIQTHPLSLCISRTGILAECAFAIYVCLNLIHSKSLSTRSAVAAVAICAGLSQVFSMGAQ